jgi:hypothetical protein
MSLTLTALPARAQAPIDAETNLSCHVNFVDAASKYTSSFNIWDAHRSHAI